MPVKYPVLLNPSLGCPRILSLDKGTPNESLFAILASTTEVSGRWSLVPSPSNGGDNLQVIQLTEREVKELINVPDLPSTVEETRDFVSRELLTEVFGGKARVFKVQLILPELAPEGTLRMVDGVPRSTLYDLCLEVNTTIKKPHAVCLTVSNHSETTFIHLTDLHLARRNDLIEIDLSAALGKIEKPVGKFNNMNENMRTFIREANTLADKGNLDLVLLGGDLVDFVNHGVSDKGDEADTNWDNFLEIVTGGGNEAEKKNMGLRVPVFTMTGNHDWRLHPYNIAYVHDPFRLSKEQAKEFDFEYFDPVEKLDAKKREVFERIAEEGSPIRKESRLSAILKFFFQVSRTWQAKTLVPILTVAATIYIEGIEEYPWFPLEEDPWFPLVVSAAAVVAHAILNYLLARTINKVVTNMVIPIEASARSLHRYFLKINPYFNYAFSFRGNHFIVMDTGPDCLTAQYFWDEGNKKMRRLSILDNLLGGSPDSMAFYPENEFYTYGQIAWLERILKAIKAIPDPNGQRRIFVCLHAPPVNLKKPPRIEPGDEVELKDPRVTIGRWRLRLLFWRPNIRYGTVNHYLSQFFHLCCGKKEGNNNHDGPVADIVFSGHAHKMIEFRIEHKDRLIVSYGKYSKKIKAEPNEYKPPYIIQTAACGPSNSEFPQPPYYRVIRIDASGKILSITS